MSTEPYLSGVMRELQTSDILEKYKKKTKNYWGKGEEKRKKY